MLLKYTLKSEQKNELNEKSLAVENQRKLRWNAIIYIFFPIWIWSTWTCAIYLTLFY